jgi:hypothetical protein
MSLLVVHGAQLRCNQGTAPASLRVARSAASDDEAPAATVRDHAPGDNVPGFGQCQSLANPAVASATAAANGTLTPQKCDPVLPGPWTPGSSHVLIGEDAALTNDSKCSCTWSGVVEITDAGGGVAID